MSFSQGSLKVVEVLLDIHMRGARGEVQTHMVAIGPPA